MSRRRRRGKDHDDGESSMMEGESDQGMLFLVPPHAIEAEARTLRRCTAALLFEREPETYKDVVKRLAEGATIRQLKKDYGLGTDTVMAIRRREAKEVGTIKSIIAETLFHGAAVGAEVAAQLVAECDDPVQAAMATKMMAETANLMKGQATQLVGVVHVHVDAQAKGAELAAKAQKMGFGWSENLVMGGAAGAVGLPSSSDNLSDVTPASFVDAECIKNDMSHTLPHAGSAGGSEETWESKGGGGDAAPLSGSVS